MKVHTNLDSFSNVQNPIVTVGTFDGVHLGHQKIIDRLKEAARKENGSSVLLTFTPHPRMVLFPNDNDLKLLSTRQEKVELLDQAGIDHLIMFPFTKEFSRLTAIEYVRDVLVNQLHLKKLIIGYDHHFGRNREGDLQHLKELAPLYSFEVEEIPAQDIDSVTISSTKIRKALQQGDVETASQYLGYSYGLNGLVVKGDQLGRSLGFPTANLQVVDSLKLIPADGVYAIRAGLKERKLSGMLNIGHRPTMTNGASKRTIEAHLFDFGDQIYDEVLRVTFEGKIRNEKQFPDMDALKKQLELDRIAALNLLDP